MARQKVNMEPLGITGGDSHKQHFEAAKKYVSGGGTLSRQKEPFHFTLLGRIYWYLCLPFHHIIFKDLIEAIEKGN